MPFPFQENKICPDCGAYMELVSDGSDVSWYCSNSTCSMNEQNETDTECEI